MKTKKLKSLSETALAFFKEKLKAELVTAIPTTHTTAEESAHNLAAHAAFAYLSCFRGSEACDAALHQLFSATGYAKYGYSVRQGFVIRSTDSSIELYPNFPERTLTISIYRPCDRYGERSGAKVNFPCFGSQSPQVVEDFAKALLVAVRIADNLNEMEAAKSSKPE